jgi:hypothetical protein
MGTVMSKKEEFLECLEDARKNGVLNGVDIPFRDRVYKGAVEKVKQTLLDFADGKEINGRVVSLSELAKLNKIGFSLWSLALNYPDVHDALKVAERARADRLNEKALDQLFDDDLLEKYALNQMEEYTSAGVNLLKARSDALMKQAAIANKGKFGKEPEVAVVFNGSAIEQVESIDDLASISVVDMQPSGKRERLK